jgi:hypothetical protein
MKRVFKMGFRGVGHDALRNMRARVLARREADAAPSPIRAIILTPLGELTNRSLDE